MEKKNLNIKICTASTWVAVVQNWQTFKYLHLPQLVVGSIIFCGCYSLSIHLFIWEVLPLFWSSEVPSWVCAVFSETWHVADQVISECGLKDNAEENVEKRKREMSRSRCRVIASVSAVTAAIEKFSSSCVCRVLTRGPTEELELCKDSKWKIHLLPFWLEKKSISARWRRLFSSLPKAWAGGGSIVSGIFFSSFRLRSHHQFSRRCGRIAERRFS